MTIYLSTCELNRRLEKFFGGTINSPCFAAMKNVNSCFKKLMLFWSCRTKVYMNAYEVMSINSYAYICQQVLMCVRECVCCQCA